MSLKKIQDKKSQVNAIFEKAETEQVAKLDKIEAVKGEILKFGKDLNKNTLDEQINRFEKSKYIFTYDGFESKKKLIETLKAVTEKFP